MPTATKSSARTSSAPAPPNSSTNSSLRWNTTRRAKTSRAVCMPTRRWPKPSTKPRLPWKAAPSTRRTRNGAKIHPPPWGRDGVGAANNPRGDNTYKPNSHLPFTYTSSAQVYVNHQTAPRGCLQLKNPPPLQDEARSGGTRGGDEKSRSGAVCDSESKPLSPWD